MIAGLGEISDGGIRIDGRCENRVARQDRDVAKVFGSHALRSHLDMAESIAFGLRVRRTPEAVIGAQVQEVAGVPGLADDPEREPAHPSDGRRPRVATGRAIVRRREAFLPDAPPRRVFSFLDDQGYDCDLYFTDADDRSFKITVPKSFDFVGAT